MLEALGHPAGLGLRSATVLEEQRVKRCTGFGVTESSAPRPLEEGREYPAARVSGRVHGIRDPTLSF